MLSMAEKIATDKEYFAYYDTGSIFVKSDTAKDIQDFFRPLNPYSLPVEMFKIEEDDNHKPLDNVMFYGISAKRYCLFDMNERQINIRKYSTHGLGHLVNINGEGVWKAILTGDFSEFMDNDLLPLSLDIFSDTQYTLESVMKMCSGARIRIPLEIQNQMIMIIFRKKL